jgi:hypothetical protein
VNPADTAFAIHKAPHVARCVAENLKRATPETHVSRWPGVGSIFRAHIIGAGHTLKPPYVVSRDERTFAVNSSIGACLSMGLVPDFIVCRESIDMSSQIRRLLPGQARAILDIGCHPATWDAALEVCRQVWWFVPAQTQLFGMAARYGVEPLYGGTSNVTASVALAVAMGARSIQLHGCSRAFSASGQAYATGTGWESVRLASVVEEDGRHVATIEGTEAKAALHAASGQRAPLARENVIPVRAVDGSTRYALEPLETDRAWLETFATRHPHLSLYQHNPDVAIAGWGHKPAIPSMPSPVDYRAEALRQCEHAEAVASAVLSGEPCVAELATLVHGAELPDYAGIGDRIQIMHAMKGHPPASRTKAIMGAWVESAARVREWVR